MVRNIVLLALSAFATAFITAKIVDSHHSAAKVPVTQKQRYLRSISCSADWKLVSSFMDEHAIQLLPGTGTYKWNISTSSDSAQLYFNQGITMYYSFHIVEAMASFKKAVTFDSSSAILYWAQALSYGPNINDFGYAASPEALKATQMAQDFMATASPVERSLIQAMMVRYTKDSTDADRAILNARYTEKMKEAYQQFPGNADVQVLYADAMMLQHPWDLWSNNGTAKSWTPVIEATLEKTLLSFPTHPGANHYYIHVMEGSPFAAKALPSAQRMAGLTPGLSHTVHMPSHIYLRTGQYNDGISVNEQAITAYQKEKELYAPAENGDLLYRVHNLHMQTTVSMLAGKRAYSMESAKATAAAVPDEYCFMPAPMGSYAQYVQMTPVFVKIRFGKWDELLNIPAPDKKMSYASVLYHFGRGMALANKLDATAAKEELLALQVAMKDTMLQVPNGVFAPAIEGAKVAEKLLSGSIALAEQNYSIAIAAFESAATTEERMTYTEPRDWLLSPRHYLGDAYLKAGDAAAAENCFRKDMLNNDNNGWALYGLYQSLLAQRKNKEAENVRKRYLEAFSEADIKLRAAVL